MTDKEVRAIAIKEVTYADMIAIGATEEIATAASWKAKCAFEASWDCAVEKACEWLNTHSETDYFELIPDANYCGAGKLNKKKMIDDFRKAMEE